MNAKADKCPSCSSMEAMIKGVAPDAVFAEESTLWDSDKYKIVVIKPSSSYFFPFPQALARSSEKMSAAAIKRNF